jgi:transcriptional regulator with XRE-family HTH domain
MDNLNPVRRAREAKGLSRAQLAKLAGLSTMRLADAEQGNYKQIPEHWRASFEAEGFDFDQLQADYLAWREAEAAELRKVVRHG